MKDLKTILALAALGVGAVVALAYFGKRGAQAAAKVAGTKLNPYSSSNVVYENVIGGAGRAISGDKNWTLGGWIYDITHPQRGR